MDKTPPEKKLSVITSHKPLSESEILEVQFEALKATRDQYVSGIIIGLVKDDSVESYVYMLPDTDIVDDMLDLIDMIKMEIIDTELGEEDDGEF